MASNRPSGPKFGSKMAGFGHLEAEAAIFQPIIVILLEGRK